MQANYNYPFSVAPMLDWTDKHCRFFHRQLSPNALLYTEMVVADAILHGDRDFLLDNSMVAGATALQLGGNNPTKIAKCSEIAQDYGYVEINLNVGCPSNKVQNGAFGACLMKDPLLVGKIIEAMKKASNLPITIKCRIAVDDQDEYQALDDFYRICKSAGADGFWIHARKAWLKGLSPKENRTIPPLNYERVYALKNKNADSFIGINGGICTIEQIKNHLRQVDGVMVGRAAYKNPHILRDIDESLFGNAPAENRIKKIDMLELADKMCNYANHHIEKGGYLSHITRHMLGLFHDKKGAKFWRQKLTEFSSNRDANGEDLAKIFTHLIEMNYI